MIFYQLDLPPREVLNRVALDLDAWTRRYKKHRLELQVWRDWLQHVILPLPQLFPLNPLPCISFLVCRESIGLYKSFQLMVGGDPPDIARKKKYTTVHKTTLAQIKSELYSSFSAPNQRGFRIQNSRYLKGSRSNRAGATDDAFRCTKTTVCSKCLASVLLCVLVLRRAPVLAAGIHRRDEVRSDRIC